ncbi:MAG: hypothetical protein NTZ95_06835 [Candidatus Omnitrophica bacterium]|nr:hypothetical protein [Candidatus Omnitrophota bacterium]
MFNNRKLDYTIIRRIVATILLVSFISTSSNAAFALAPSGKLNDESFQQAYASLDSTTRVLDAIGEALYLKMPISGVREMVERRTGKPSPITIDRIEDAAVCFSFRDPQGKIRYYRCFLAEDGIIPADSIRLSLPGDRVYWRQEIDEPMPSSTRQPPKNAETAARLSHEAFVSYLNIEFPDRRKDYDSRISLIIRYGLHDGDEIDVLISKTYKVLSRPSEALPADVKDVVNFLLLLDVNEGWLKRVFFQYEKLFDKEAGMDGSANKRASIGKVQDDPGYLWSNPSVSDSFIKSAGYFEKFLKYKKNDVSLHILAGMGREAIYMAKRNPGMTFFSLDANIFNMRESLSELADIEKEAVPLQNLRLIMADARATHQGIPLPENSVDSVVIIGQGFASMIKNEVFGITQEVLKVINKNGGVILFDGEDMPEEMRQAIEVRKDVVTESVYDGRLGNYLFPIHVIRIKKRNDTSLKSPELSGWGLDGVKKALKDLAPTDWYYRTAVIPMKNGQVLAVKFLKKGEDPAVLEKEAIIMRDLNSAGISVPVPQRMVGDTYTFACGVTPSNPPYGVDNSYQCIAYLARPEYFIYPEDIKDTGTMRRCAVNSMDQFARMLKVGYVHTSLSPLSHAQSMEKPWMWNHNPLGGVEDMEEAAAKSNIRLAGVADFAHVRLTLPGESLYNETVQALCEWIIVITYHSLKNGITEGDVALILKDGLNEFLKITDLKNGITVTESDRLEEFITLAKPRSLIN